MDIILSYEASRAHMPIQKRPYHLLSRKHSGLKAVVRYMS